MGLTIANVVEAFRRLLPRGPAWSFTSESTFADLLEAFAEEYLRIDGRIDVLMREADPRQTQELLSDWERVAGLPDACTGVLTEEDDRRLALWQRLTESGGQSIAFYKALARKVGYEIEIYEFRPFTAGSFAGGRLFSDAWAHSWQVVAFTDGIPIFALECIMRRLAPAHTTVFFSYPNASEPAFFLTS
ncbi:YmfQ family protein [Asticcacaulis sp. AND118]|uniref:YmfQ family protein n=1 Tax=Asticcacaulis sp. AND118 TaxID=2840468 RepID=UPI001D001412|nr:putative phage tail protein [Asticcacaulis sp. AND118]UDF02989.1 DUF2313 domain-containing protein [Asticcacaulis sp. AND118]